MSEQDQTLKSGGESLLETGEANTVKPVNPVNPKESECMLGGTSSHHHEESCHEGCEYLHHKHDEKCGLLETVFRDPTVQQLSKLIQTEHDQYTLLGKTGLRVCRIGLGTMNFGAIDPQMGNRPGQLTNKEEVHKILDRYVELGGNLIDTADFYPWFGETSGQTETLIGEWIHGRTDRHHIIITTKVGMPTNMNNPNAFGLSRNNLIQSVDASLQRLQTNYIDILQVTMLDNSEMLFSELIENLTELIASGKVNYIGLCDVRGCQTQKLVDLAKAMRMHRIACVDAEYNLLTRGTELEVVEVCREERLGFFAYAPLKAGYLTEHFSGNTRTAPEDTRIGAASEFNLAACAEPMDQMQQNHQMADIMTVCEKIAKKRNRTIAQVAIRYVIQRNFVNSCIIGCSNIQQLEENMAVLQQRLTNDEMHELNHASSIRVPYPYGPSNPATNVARFLHSNKFIIHRDKHGHHVDTHQHQQPTESVEEDEGEVEEETALLEHAETKKEKRQRFKQTQKKKEPAIQTPRASAQHA